MCFQPYGVRAADVAGSRSLIRRFLSCFAKRNRLPGSAERRGVLSKDVEIPVICPNLVEDVHRSLYGPCNLAGWFVVVLGPQKQDSLRQAGPQKPRYS